jgi:hypothetical protein
VAKTLLAPDGSPLKKKLKNEEPELALTATVAWLKDEIDTHERIFDKFHRRGRKIIKKYRDVRSPREDAITRYNIFWANVQTRLPALYARNPKPLVERRYKDRDPIGRTAAEILERSIEYTLEHVNDFFYTMRLAILDYEGPGLAAVWIRYEPHFHDPELPGAVEEGMEPEKENLETESEGSSTTSAEEDEVQELELKHEETKIDYVSWEDVGWSWARTWQEVRLLWKRVFMDRDELRERFGGKGGLTEEEILQIPLDWSPKNLTDTQIRITRKKAVVYEVHDKHERKRYWLVKNFPKVLDERDDDLGLTKFFPVPRPLMANALSDELIPTPNLSFYQDQANEIDELSTRIVAITKALKVAGVRDASAEALDRLLSEGVENQLVPVSGWAVHADKGGLKGSFELLPIAEIAECLGYLREQRKELIEDVYQLTGIADIVRGFSDPNETATAQQLKGDFSIIRIQDAQTEVQRFVRDIVRIVGEIVAGYSIETLKCISGVKLLTNLEKQQLQFQLAMQAAQQQMQQQPPAPQGGPTGSSAPQLTGPGAAPQQAQQGQMHPQAPPQAMTPASGQATLSPDKMKLLELPTWEEIEGLLKNPVLREFRLDIETDSTIRMDDEVEQKARIELIAAVGGFLDKAILAGSQAPEIVPMLGELLMFGVRAYRSARPIEQAFEDAMDALQKAAKQPKPNPEMMKAQLEAQTKIAIATQQAQLDKQIADAKQQAESKQDQIENQLEAARAQQDAELQAKLQAHKTQIEFASKREIEQMKLQFEAEKVQYEGETKMKIEQMKAGHQVQIEQVKAGHQLEVEKVKGEHAQKTEEVKAGHALKQKRLELNHEAGMHERDPDNVREDEVSKAVKEMVEHFKKPRKIVRDKDGRISELH